MNRIVTTNVEGISPATLPPPERAGPARVLFLTATFLGFGTYFRQMVQYTGERDDVDAVHVELRAPLWLKAIGKASPLHVRGWDFHPYRHLHLWRWLIRSWLNGPLPIERFDVVHFITQCHALVLLDIKRHHHVAAAVNIDATAEHAVTEYGFSRRATKPFIRAEQRLFDAADLIVCRNRWCRRSLHEDFSVPEEKIQVACNSMHPMPKSRADFPPRAEGELPRLVFVGNAFWRKGGPELLRLHQESLADRAELHVFSRRARPDHSARNVVWHGAVPREKLLNEILPTMDIFVMPTRHDMHPWAIMEAASAGLPVVSSRLAGIPDMVIDGRTGVLCPVEDWAAVEKALDRLIGDPQLRCEMGRAAREHIVRQYNPDDQFNGLLDRLIALAHDVRQKQAHPESVAATP